MRRLWPNFDDELRAAGGVYVFHMSILGIR